MAADPAGRVLVADTRGEALLVFGTDPLILRQRYPVRGAPYGLAGSSTAGLGVADGDEQRGWLRSGHRNTRREGALSNRAATELPGLRRRVRHPVCGVGLGSGCAGDRRRGGAPMTHDAARPACPRRGRDGPTTVRRVRVGAAAAAAGRDQGQRIDPAVDRGRVPRLGADPGARSTPTAAGGCCCAARSPRPTGRGTRISRRTGAA